jgi:hypothetical protein
MNYRALWLTALAWVAVWLAFAAIVLAVRP